MPNQLLPIHEGLFADLSIKTFVMQFYRCLTPGYFSKEEAESANRVNDRSVEKLQQMKDPLKWDGNYKVVISLLGEISAIAMKAKSFLQYRQICSDRAIADYLVNHPEFFSWGIDLNSLRNILDIDVLFRNGYMLHNIFLGYPKRDMYSFAIDCLDYVHSASYFYNEAYDLYHNNKLIRDYSNVPADQIGKFEFTRIQTREEAMFRNFREAYINIILFIESFINSVGYDAYLAGRGSTPGEGLKLKGIQGTRANGKYNYSTLVNKIENISQIVGGTKIDVADEPYATYLDEDVSLRNSYIHSKPADQQPRFTFEDWKRKCDDFIGTNCQLILDAFWKACYPARPFPIVIFNAFHGNSFKGIQHKMMAEIP